MIDVRSFTKNYPDFAIDASLRVQPGRIVGLVGENGAGKTTLFKAILNLIHVQAGTVTVNGTFANAMTPADREHLGVVLADTGYNDRLNATDIRRIQNALYPQFDADFYVQQLQNFNIKPKMQLRKYSTGMTAALKIIIAISHNADTLILDEPTSGLDVAARTKILRLLQEYMDADPARCILISSHIASDLEQICDEVYFMHQGHIRLHATIDTITEEFGLVKMTAEQYPNVDSTHFLGLQQTSFGYQALTADRDFYQDNYPAIIVDRPRLDDVLLMVIAGTITKGA